jgi:DNA-binding response OmpR family regulator
MSAVERTPLAHGERPVACAPVTSSSIRLLICDDESSLREGLRQSFERQGHRVVAVPDGRQAIDQASTSVFDLMLLDISLGPGSPDGCEVCRELRRRGNPMAIIMLTARDGEADAVSGLEAGADDYVVKPFRPAELRSRIRAVLRRAGPPELGNDLLQIADVVVDLARHEVRRDGQPVDATFSEFKLLTAMLLSPGRVFDRQELLEAIWGDSAYRDPRAIDVHIRHLREKLEPTPEKPRLIVTVRGAGYRLAES